MIAFPIYRQMGHMCPVSNSITNHGKLFPFSGRHTESQGSGHTENIDELRPVQCGANH
jgi:hypothetical protein